MANLSVKAALRNNPGLRAINAFVEAAAGDDAPEVMAARAAREQHAEQGRAAQASGASFEEELEELHDQARTSGLADVEKLHVGVVDVSRKFRDAAALLSAHDDNRPFIAKRSKRCGADYRGVLRGGVPVVVEAKNAGRARLPLKDDGSPRFSGVKAHQRAALERCLKLGGVSLLVVRFTRAGGTTTYAVPWDAVSGLESIGPDDVDAWRLRPRELYLERWARRTP